MNVERLEQLAQRIEKEPVGQAWSDREGFGMCQFIHECGTPSCIGGYACDMAVEYGYDQPYSAMDIPDVARSWLELDSQTAYNLFNPHSVEGEWNGWQATPAQAAQIIRHLIATGEVSWIIAKPEGE